MTMKSIKRNLANLGRLVLLLAFAAGATAARAQINVQKVSGGANSITQDLAIGVGRTLTIAGTITGSGNIGTTGTITAGSFSATTLSVSTLSVSTLTASVASIATASISAGAAVLSSATITAGTVTTLTATTESVSTSSISTLTLAGTLRALSPTSGIGYGTGAGGTVAQTTSKSNAVTLNTVVGQITLSSFSLSSATNVSFTLTNSAIGANDVLIPAVSSGGTQGAYQVWVSTIGTGSASFTVRNATAATLSESPVISYIVVKGSAN